MCRCRNFAIFSGAASGDVPRETIAVDEPARNLDLAYPAGARGIGFGLRRYLLSRCGGRRVPPTPYGDRAPFARGSPGPKALPADFPFRRALPPFLTRISRTITMTHLDYPTSRELAKARRCRS